jgi:hypothetical protein
MRIPPSNRMAARATVTTRWTLVTDTARSVGATSPGRRLPLEREAFGHLADEREPRSGPILGGWRRRDLLGGLIHEYEPAA